MSEATIGRSLKRLCTAEIRAKDAQSLFAHCSNRTGSSNNEFSVEKSDNAVEQALDMYLLCVCPLGVA
jgi:hypothetical protein